MDTSVQNIFYILHVNFILISFIIKGIVTTNKIPQP